MPILTFTLIPFLAHLHQTFKLTLIPRPRPCALFECSPLNQWHLAKQRDFVSNPARVLGGKVAVISCLPTKPLHISTVNAWDCYEEK